MLQNLPQMSKETETCDAYTKFALHIHACKQEVTLDKIKNLCKAGNIEFQSRLASMFVMPKNRYDEILLSINSGSVASGESDKKSDKKEDKKEEFVVEEESSVGDQFMNFED